MRKEETVSLSLAADCCTKKLWQKNEEILGHRKMQEGHLLGERNCLKTLRNIC